MVAHTQMLSRGWTNHGSLFSANGNNRLMHVDQSKFKDKRYLMKD
jgi:hypothetical protein